jgi:hypothetical protein
VVGRHDRSGVREARAEALTRAWAVTGVEAAT